MSDATSTPVADYDSPWKEAFTEYLEHAVALFLPAVHPLIDWVRGYDVLDKELQQATHDAALGRRLADLLVRVWRRDGSEVWVLIHIEVQGQPDPDFARRMFVYHYRIYDQHARPILSVAVLVDEQTDWRPDRFTQELWGCEVAFRYPVVKLLDWRARADQLAASPNPFAMLVRAHLAAQETRHTPEARQRTKLGLIRGLYERGYERAQVLRLFRLIDWLLVLPAEREQTVWQEIERLEEERTMPYITSVERIGRAEGAVDGKIEDILTVLRERFGAVPATVEERVRSTRDSAALTALLVRALHIASLDEL